MPVPGTERVGFHLPQPATRGRSGRELHSVSEPSYSQVFVPAGQRERETLAFRADPLLLRRPRPAAGEGLHGLLDTGNIPLDVLHVQPSSDNLIVSDLEQRHPAHLEGLPVAAGPRPAPFSPGRATVLDRPADFGVEIGDPREHGLPVGEHLGSPGEGPAGVRRLLAAVILVDETGYGIEIVGVHGHGQPVNHVGHQVLPWLAGYCADAPPCGRVSLRTGPRLAVRWAGVQA